MNSEEGMPVAVYISQKKKKVVTLVPAWESFCLTKKNNE
jgi:hypothetical protein